MQFDCMFSYICFSYYICDLPVECLKLPPPTVYLNHYLYAPCCLEAQFYKNLQLEAAFGFSGVLFGPHELVGVKATPMPRVVPQQLLADFHSQLSSAVGVGVEGTAQAVADFPLLEDVGSHLGTSISALLEY